MSGNGDTRALQQLADQAVQNAKKDISNRKSTNAATNASDNLHFNVKVANTKVKTWLGLIDANNKEIVAKENEIVSYSLIIKANPSSAVIYNPLIVEAGTAVQKLKASNTSLYSSITAATSDLKALGGVGATTAADKAAAISYKPRSGSGGTGGAGGTGAGPQPLTYHYNAPMVRSAYFNPLGPQRNMLGSEVIIDQGKYDDALIGAWNGQGGRGTIQMDRTINPTTVVNNLKTDKSKIDTNLYGFKFLYNPTTVNMSWGVSAAVNPVYESLSLDAATPLAAGLIQSTVSFELLLNRIEDFKYIDENGLKKVQTGSTTTKAYLGSELSQITSPIYTNIENPYPYPVSDTELKLIYKKGTMYDLEYLFRTLMGFNTKITSALNGETSDRGWLTNLSIELHLGSGLRYRVRVSSLEVQHIMFNERMTPILSKVTMTCTRYADFSSATQDAARLKATNNGANLTP